jgi:Holliday junction resolvase RusA-like endonuclease
MEFFIDMVPPTVTAQTRRVTFQGGKPHFYQTKQLKDAKELFCIELMRHRPDQPLQGAVRLHVTWMFPTKTHKEGEWRITRPDTDNLQKLLKDCMTETGYWKDDSQVAVECIGKMWVRSRPGIQIKAEEIHD